MDISKIAGLYGYNEQDFIDLLRKNPKATPSASLFAKTGILPEIPKATVQIPEYTSDFKPFAQSIPEYTSDFTPISQSPDVVSPTYKESPVTQQFNNYNPGMGYYDNLHKGVDIGGQQGEDMKFPVGGTVTQTGYDPAYGYNIEVMGQNPLERAQTDPNQPLVGKGQEDVYHLSHLAELPQVKPGDYVATGSAGLKMGSTGNVTGPHVDIEKYNLQDKGNYALYQNFLDFLKKKASNK